jgi:hypothetical protein
MSSQNLERDMHSFTDQEIDPADVDQGAITEVAKFKGQNQRIQA